MAVTCGSCSANAGLPIVRLPTISTSAAPTLAIKAAAAPPPGAGALEPSASSHPPMGWLEAGLMIASS
jgi:hypothetical protein